jgi:hypothetical protein
MSSKQGSGGGGLSRREFVSAAAAAAFTIVPRRVLGAARQSSANNKLNIAGIGVGGRGVDDIKEVAGENIVALCDADLDRASATIKAYPKATLYRDFRRMLEKEAKDIDAVVIGTPERAWWPRGVERPAGEDPGAGRARLELREDAIAQLPRGGQLRHEILS